MQPWIVIAVMGGVVLVLAVAGVLIWRPIRRSLRSAELSQARLDFHRQRERLEAKFLELAAASGRPRGLRWVSCDFDDDVAYARDRRSGQLAAFVAVTIGFEAIPGGPMEEVEAVGNLRYATAVFRREQQRWQTEGRAVFNLNPADTIAYYRDDLESVGCEIAHPHSS
jgi:hypothetical protein